MYKIVILFCGEKGFGWILQLPNARAQIHAHALDYYVCLPRASSENRRVRTLKGAPHHHCTRVGKEEEEERRSGGRTKEDNVEKEYY